MSRSISFIISLLILCSFGCRAQSSQPNRPAGNDADNPAFSNSLSIPIDEDEMKQLTEPDRSPNPDAEKAVAFLRRFKIGQSLDQVKKSLPSGITLRRPTVDLPFGEMPENLAAVQFIGDQDGCFYFEGTPNKMGNLVMVEVFTDDKSYKDGAGRRRVRSFTSLLGKPYKLRKEEDDDGSPLYEADWRDGDAIVRYADIYEWGSTLILNPIDAGWR